MPDDLNIDPMKSYEAPEPGIPGSTLHKVENPKPETPVKAPESEGKKEHTSLTQTLTALNNSISEQSSSARLMADPQIRAYLDAKAAGKNVGFAEVQRPVEQFAPPELPKDLDNLSNTELMKLNADQIRSYAKSEASRIAEEKVNALREELRPQMNVMHDTVQHQQVNLVKQQIEDVKKEFSDFESMRSSMEVLSRTTTGMSVRELYVLAKVRAGQQFVSQNQIESERPSTTAGPRKEFKRSETPYRGRGGFSSLVSNALEHSIGPTKE